MATSQYKEDLSSLIPALHLLHNIGYKYLTETLKSSNIEIFKN